VAETSSAVIVYTKDGPVSLPEVTRYCTDEHNNLELMAGRDGETAMECFASGYWLRVGVDGGE
jgi:hypothetical protein